MQTDRRLHALLHELSFGLARRVSERRGLRWWQAGEHSPNAHEPREVNHGHCLLSVKMIGQPVDCPTHVRL